MRCRFSSAGSLIPVCCSRNAISPSSRTYRLSSKGRGPESSLEAVWGSVLAGGSWLMIRLAVRQLLPVGAISGIYKPWNHLGHRLVGVQGPTEAACVYRPEGQPVFLPRAGYLCLRAVADCTAEYCCCPLNTAHRAKKGVRTVHI
jgi:hypothetical protein